MGIDAQTIMNQMQMELDTALSKMVQLDSDDKDVELLPTGIDALDLILGGGIALNKLTLIAGDPGTFKSTLAITVCAKLKEKYPESLIVYLDSENATSIQRMRQLGLSDVVPRTNLTVEKVFATIQALMTFKDEKKIKDVPTIVVWDSIANTPTDAEMNTTDNINQTIGLKARIISSRLPVIINKTKEYNITLLFINQFREKVQIGMFPSANDLKNMASDKTLPGGNSPKFNASQFLQLRVSRVYDYKTSPYGFRSTVVRVKTVKNKFFPDGYEVDLVVDPAIGFSNLYTNMEILKAQKKLVTGAWSYLKDYPEKKFQGIKKLKDVYANDPIFRQKFDDIVKQTLEELRSEMSQYQSVETISAPDEESITENSNQQIEKTEQITNNSNNNNQVTDSIEDKVGEGG